MYKVVIIDDEPIIVTGLSRLMPWKTYECEVVGTAYNGQEGLELIQKVKPDIVFSDIYMPKMDGLLMAAAIKSEFEDIELTILTGYRDFELVQQALNIGVTRFVLKPSNMDELEEALKTMTSRLKKKGIYPQQDEMPMTKDMRQDVDSMAEKLMDTTEMHEAETHTEDNPASNFIVRNALEYMRENYKRKLTLAEVAEHTFVSQWHLSKLLNRNMQQSFSELLNTIRIEEAKKLLANPALRVGDVAEQVGFLDIAHFSRVFKKITGISANVYRNQLK